MTKKMTLLIVFISILSLLPLGAGNKRQDDEDHLQWLRGKYVEAKFIQVGMTRADILKLFAEDGGVQRVPASRFNLKSCPLIKIEAEFDTPYGQAHKETPDSELKIIKVSEPYLELPLKD